MKPPLSARAALAVIRAVSRLVPSERRREWRLEWEAEILHRSSRFGGENQPMAWHDHIDLLKRIGGAVPDAAWVRRQLGPDADLLRDTRQGLKSLARDRGFAFAATGVLALGLGAATTLFALADGLMLRPLPYPDADRIMTVWQVSAATGQPGPVAPANFLDWRERSRSFQNLAAAIPYSYDYRGTERPEPFFGAQVTDGFFDAFGVRPLMGRLFQTKDHDRGSAHVCLIGERLWRLRFDADPKIVGRALELSGVPFEVVGVLPKEFEPIALSSAPGRRDLWTPHLVAEYEKRIRGSAWWGVVARLGPGATKDSAQAELDVISSALAQENPQTNRSMKAGLLPLTEHLTSALRPALGLMAGAVALLIGIVWANAAGLLLARGVRRDREFAIRASLGAGRGRMLRQILAETLLVSLIGGGLGLFVSYASLRVIVTSIPVEVPRLDQIALDGRSLAFLAAFSVLTAVACGLSPALRFSIPRFQNSAADRLRSSAVRAGSAVRSGLVVSEVALALLLLVGSGLLTRSLGRMLAVDPGFKPDGVATLQVFTRGRDPQKTGRFLQEAIERMRSLPGVTAAGAVSRMPFMEANLDIRGPMRIAGDAPAEPGQEPSVSLAVATAGYFETMRIPLIEGRGFDNRDQAGAAAVVLVNESLARRYLPQGAVGRMLSLQWEGRMREAQVIGVVGGVRQEKLDGEPEPEAFFPHAQLPFSSMSFVLRTSLDPATIIEPAKRTVWALEPSQTFYRTATLDDLIRKTVADRRFLSILISAFAGLALLLTASGLYGLISVLTSERTREFGVRLALGATGADLRAIVIRQGLSLVIPGLLLGLLGAAVGVPALRGVLFGISPFDPMTFVLMSAFLLVVAMLACLGPARRALNVNPIAALRDE